MVRSASVGRLGSVDIGLQWDFFGVRLRGSLCPVGSLKSGWMMKQGGSVKTWKRRFFVLKGLALAYYETEYDTTPKGTTTGHVPCRFHRFRHVKLSALRLSTSAQPKA